jgi:uncharacterized protein with NRDE domain
MCLAVIALDAHPHYALVIAANRDEFHARAAQPAHWWDRGVLAGRDEAGGGTWFGMTRNGRWALVTNFREGIPRDPAAPSRGALVLEALQSMESPLECAAHFTVDGSRYHGFNLLVGDLWPRCAYVSNRASGARAIASGLIGLSNHLLETPWPKVTQSKSRLAKALAGDGDLIESVFALLADRTPAPAASLPSTGVSEQWERVLSPAFIVTPSYGTRCSTVVVADKSGGVRFVERSFDAAGTITGEAAFEFVVEKMPTP